MPVRPPMPSVNCKMNRCLVEKIIRKSLYSLRELEVSIAGPRF